jgi:NADPH:quinone reductase-like Zn-dependent oxidoreductase
MKVIARDRYGSPDVMRVEEADLPEVADDQVLVRVRATSVNAVDWHTLRGKPYIARTDEGLRTPKSRVLGVDVAGEVERVGAGVTDLEPGDRVFGARSGAFAQYVSGRNLVPLPAKLTFEQGGAVAVAGVTALQGLRDRGQLAAGQHVLINGAGGGVGTFAVQIARALGAEVTAVTNANSVDLVRSIGANHALDYAKEDFTRAGERYDLILDVGGHHSLRRLRRALKPGGRVVLVAPAGGQWIGPIARVVWAAVTSRFSAKKVIPFLSAMKRDDLFVLRELMETEKLIPVIDRTFRFEETPDAVRYVESGNARGKVVIAI